MMPHQIMLTIGSILLVSLVFDWIGRRTGVPRVTLLVVMGVAVGPYGLGLLPTDIAAATEFISAFALTMIAFLLGSELSSDKLQEHGRGILLVSITVVLVTAVTVGIGLLLVGAPPALAVLLAAVATATAPAATRDVVNEYEAKGPFKDLLLGIVAVDDAWGLIVFGFAMAAAAFLLGADGNSVWANLGAHLGGAVAIGFGIGVPAAYLSGRLKPGRPSQLEAIGVVLVCGGLAFWIGASYLLAATIAGALVANLAKHHDYAFREIEHFEWPFLTVFFVLAGATLDLAMVQAAGIVGVAYVGLRTVGRVAGGWIGAGAAGLKAADRNWIGCALMPQAGVAVGMGLIAAQEVPAVGDLVLAVTIGGAVVFELVGPVLTRTALIRTGAADLR